MSEAEKEAREALIEAATWELIEWDTDTSDRGVRDEHYRDRRADVERVLAVFREHTEPGGDDREVLKRVISDSVGGWNKNTQAITRTADAVLAAGFRRGAPAEPAVTDGGVRAALRVWYRSAWGGGWTPEHESRMRAALVAGLSIERGEK